MKHGYIYKITIGPNYYIGQTVDPAKRKSHHLYSLKKGAHDNPRVQNAYNKYREFRFDVIRKLPVSLLSAAESSIVKSSIGESRCMNIHIPLPGDTYLHSERTKEKIGNALRGRNTDKRQKPCVFASRHGEVVRFDGAKDAASSLGVSQVMIYACLNGKTKWPLSNKSPLKDWVGWYEEEGRPREGSLSERCKRKQVENPRGNRARSGKPCLVLMQSGEQFQFNSVKAAADFIGVTRQNLNPYINGERNWPRSGPLSKLTVFPDETSGS